WSTDLAINPIAISFFLWEAANKGVWGYCFPPGADQLVAQLLQSVAQLHMVSAPINPYICSVKASEINKKWAALQAHTAQAFDMEMPDIKIMLFLIGVQELGKGPMKFSKRQKEELMHIATCRLFSSMG